MSLVVRVCLVAVFGALAACGEFIIDDKDFSDNRRNLDVTNDNAEAYLWSSYQAIYAPLYYSRLNEMLDARYFGNSQAGDVACLHGGRAQIDFPNAVFAVYEEGDRFTLTFDNCSQISGVTLNGVIKGEYKEITGYNTAFVDAITVNECIAEITDQDFDAAPREIIDEAQSVVFDKQGTRLFVRYLDPDPDDALAKIEVNTYELSLSDEAIVVNHSATHAPSASKEDGALLYAVKDGVHEEIDCAFYERSLELDLQGFTVEAEGAVHTLDGLIELSNAFKQRNQRDYHVEAQQLKSSFTVGFLDESYYLNDLSWRMEYGNAVDANYAAAFSAEAESTSSGVIFEPRVSSGAALRGKLNAFTPKQGVLAVDGKDDENMALNIVSDLSVTIAIQAEGDRDGNGRGDLTAPFFDLTWAEFLARDFVRPPVQDVE